MKTFSHILLWLLVLAAPTAFAQVDNGKQTPNDSIAKAYTAYIERSKACIKRNEHSIDSVKENCEKHVSIVKAKYDTQIAAANPKEGKAADDLTSKRDKRIADIRSKCDVLVAKLEAKNDVIRQQVKDANPGGWPAMQAKMNSDMDAFEQFLIVHDADKASDD